MNRLFLAAGLVAMFAAGASASTITYDTLSSQICFGALGCGLTSATIGSVNVSFTGVSASVDPASLGGNTTFGSFGDLIISCVGGGTACGGQSLAGLNVYITVHQTVPSTGSSTIPSGVITGSVSGTASSAVITWPSANSVTIGSITYGVKDNPLSVTPPSSHNGDTSIQAIITQNGVPEPTTYAMLAAGLLGLGLTRRRR